MHRTTVMIPPELKRRASEQAKLQDVSLGEFMRRALEAAVKQNGKPRAGDDPLLRDAAVFRGRTPRDLSTHHDAYLYGKRRLR
ncbi:CopG domain protein DNA-binding domain protein [Candidatus Sulfopaludibacter sp. SbA4]|nr:CopG domain protein DNA-binding domain protein [Candidatus Sulfopaludibacter sp. SbA4]